MVTTTTVYSFQKPAVAGDEDAWGGYLNNNIDKYESILTGNTTITSLVITTADINGGTLDNVVIGGTTAAEITGTTITGTSLVGNVTGNVSGSSGSTTGNAATATALANARTIGGVSFDGTANINLAGVNTAGNQDTSGNAATATTAGTVTTAAQPNITSLGTLTTLTVDDITINGSAISDSGDFYIDVGGDIILDADGGDVKISDGGTHVGSLRNVSSDFVIQSIISDNNIIFKGNDGGSEITAMSLDMSEAGSANFNAGATFGGVVQPDSVNSIDLGANGAEFRTLYIDTSVAASNALTISTGTDLTLDAAGVLNLDAGTQIVLKDDNSNYGTFYQSSSDFYIQSLTQDKDIVFYGNDNGSGVTALRIDMSDAGSATFNNNIYIPNQIIHSGDTDTYVEFAINEIKFSAGGEQEMKITTGGVFLDNAALNEDYDALSGTSPTISTSSGGMFSLTMSGNTTFTFQGATSGYSVGFILQLTGNGGTVTYPNTVRWAGGSAPDAPASGETDILVFITRDGGSNWYGVLSSDAAS